MIPLEEARSFVLGLGKPLAPADVTAGEALGCVLAAGISAREDSPGFDNSAMDGFAVRAADVTLPGAVLEVAGTQLAGPDLSVPLPPGSAVRIMTGAPLPIGADAVVRVEDTEPVDSAGRVRLLVAAVRGDHLRRAGEDYRAGDVVLPAGSVLTPAAVAALASVGAERVSVVPRPLVGVLSTGDELVDVGVQPGRGQVRDSNRPGLLAAVEAAGGRALDLGRCGDDENALTEALSDGVRRCDLVLTSGGVSMGDADLVRVVLDRLGEMRWMQIAVKPAKPLAAGTVDGTPVVGLPGNPVSSLVSFELFARPLLDRLAGRSRLGGALLRARCPSGLVRRRDGKVHVVRVGLSVDDDGRWIAHSGGGQGSHQLGVLARSAGLALVPDGDGVAEGDEVVVLCPAGWR